MRSTPWTLTLALALAACPQAPTDDDTDVADTDATGTDDAPAELEVAIDPEEPMVGDELKCDVDGYDGDVEFSWEVDGDDADIDEDEVPGGVIDAYQTWKCLATGEDGEEGEAEVEVGEACTSMRSGYYEDTIAYTHWAPELDLTDDSLTVEAWVFWDDSYLGDVSFGSTVAWSIVSRGSAALAAVEDVGDDYTLRVYSNGDVGFITGNYKDACAALVTAADLPPGEWVHLAGTYDADSGDKTIYVNGVEKEACNTAVRTDRAYGGPSVGANLGRGPYAVFPGWIDEVRLSSTVRYTDDFEPAIYHHTDDDTAWLLHFNDRSNDFALDTGSDTDTDANIGKAFVGTSDSSGNGLHPRLWERWMIDDTTSACDAPGEAQDSDWEAFDTYEETDLSPPK